MNNQWPNLFTLIGREDCIKAYEQENAGMGSVAELWKLAALCLDIFRSNWLDLKKINQKQFVNVNCQVTLSFWNIPYFVLAMSAM